MVKYVPREGVPVIETVAMEARHAEDVLAIFQAGVDSGDATFETSAPSWDEFDQMHLAAHRFVALDDDQVIGWAAVSAVSDRCVYEGVVEESVYVHPKAQRQGVGRALLRTVIDSTERAGIWTIQTGIFPENLASIRLHESVGFRLVGIRQRIGRHEASGRWRDVLFLERRSPTVGYES